MPFSLRIRRSPSDLLDGMRVDVPLTVLGSKGPITHPFRLDTACGVTTVSERVANALGLPPGGRPVTGIRVATGVTTGRSVSVRFRFPSDRDSGVAGLEVVSEWIVVAMNYDYEHLGFPDFHNHFNIATDALEMHFTER